MQTQAQVTDDNAPQWKFFVRGFLVRLVYGLLGFLILFAIRSDLMTRENLGGAVWGVAIYLCVCLFGGIYDSSIRRKVPFCSFGKPRPRELLLLIFIILLMFFLHRK
jgi:hypothetical protein